MKALTCAVQGEFQIVEKKYSVNPTAIMGITSSPPIWRGGLCGSEAMSDASLCAV
jgi:hypothetical protein